MSSCWAITYKKGKIECTNQLFPIQLRGKHCRARAASVQHAQKSLQIPWTVSLESWVKELSEVPVKILVWIHYVLWEPEPHLNPVGLRLLRQCHNELFKISIPMQTWIIAIGHMGNSKLNSNLKKSGKCRVLIYSQDSQIIWTLPCRDTRTNLLILYLLHKVNLFCTMDFSKSFEKHSL